MTRTTQTTPTRQKPRRFTSFIPLAAAALLLSGLAGCRADYSVDVRNQTPQPLFVQVYERTGDNRQIVLGATRLGPGDRGAISSVRGRIGRVGMALDTPGNPGGIVMLDLAQGTSVFNVTQQGDQMAGPLQVREVTR